MKNKLETSGIIFKKVNFSYPKQNPVLKNLNFKIQKGKFVGIIGSNGSGKSTLSLLLNGLIPHHVKGKLEGEVLVDGVSTKSKKVNYFARHVGMVFQNPEFSIFNLTVKDEILFGLENLEYQNKNERVQKALKTVGLEGLEDKDPNELSLGQKQKLALACVLAMDTEYIVLDEPSAMLDYKSSLEIYNHLKKLNEKGKTIITVEHDTDILNNFVDKILLLGEDGLITFDSKENVFKQKNVLESLGIKVPRKT
jgi:energy-coupling factor transport system ATP-binding protein